MLGVKFHFFFKVLQEGTGKTGYEWHPSGIEVLAYEDDVNLIGDDIRTIEINANVKSL